MLRRRGRGGLHSKGDPTRAARSGVANVGSPAAPSPLQFPSTLFVPMSKPPRDMAELEKQELVEPRALTAEAPVLGVPMNPPLRM
eukprot:366466-Chlamydomonas_euryale.AAC.9